MKIICSFIITMMLIDAVNNAANHLLNYKLNTFNPRNGLRLSVVGSRTDIIFKPAPYASSAAVVKQQCRRYQILGNMHWFIRYLEFER